MFNFFNRKKNQITQNINEFVKIAKALANTLGNDELLKALDEGLVLGFDEIFETKKYNYYDLNLNMKIYNLHQDKSEDQFSIKGVTVKDKITTKIISLEFIFVDSLIKGVAIPKSFRDFDLDASTLNLRYFKKIYKSNKPLEFLKNILKKEEIEILKTKNVYEVEIEDEVFYHLKSLDDGDFLGIDQNGAIFKFTHDPFEIKKQNLSIIEIFNQQKNGNL